MEEVKNRQRGQARVTGTEKWNREQDNTGGKTNHDGQQDREMEKRKILRKREGKEGTDRGI